MGQAEKRREAIGYHAAAKASVRKLLVVMLLCVVVNAFAWAVVYGFPACKEYLACRVIVGGALFAPGLVFVLAVFIIMAGYVFPKMANLIAGDPEGYYGKAARKNPYFKAMLDAERGDE